MALSVIANLAVSSVLMRQAATHESLALEGDAAHLRTDAFTSAGVLVGLALVQITGVVALDSITALLVAALIVVAGIRIMRRSSGVLVDEALPDEEMDRIESAIGAARTPEVAGYHKLRARRAGPAALHRPPRAVPLGHQPRGRPPPRPRDARRDRGGDPAGRGADPRRAGDVGARPRHRQGPFPRRLNVRPGGSCHRFVQPPICRVRI